MKTAFLSLVFIFSFHNFSTAQTYLGIKAGAMPANISIVKPDSLENKADIRLSYLVGCFVSISSDSKLNGQIELLYSNKGAEYFYLHYLNLPFILRYKIMNRLEAEIGSEVGYLIGSYSEPFFSPSSRRFDIKKFDLGINAGLNYKLLDRLDIGLRYIIGIQDIHNSERARRISPNVPLPDYNVQNRNLQITMNWKLGRYWF